MALSTRPADTELYFGGSWAIALTQNHSFSSLITVSRNACIAGSLSDLTIKSGCPTRQILRLLPGPPRPCIVQACHRSPCSASTENGVAPLVISVTYRCLFLSISEDTVVHVCHKSTVLFFSLSFVGVRTPCTTTSPTHITIWTVTACIVCSNLLIRWLQWSIVCSECTGFPCIVVTVIVHQRLVVSLCLSQRFQLSFIWSHKPVPFCRNNVSSAVQSTSVFLHEVVHSCVRVPNVVQCS